MMDSSFGPQDSFVSIMPGMDMGAPGTEHERRVGGVAIFLPHAGLPRNPLAVGLDGVSRARLGPRVARVSVLP